MGFVVSLATATTGFWDWWKGLQRDRRTGIIGRAAHTQVWRTANWHMTLMLTTTGVVIIDLIVRLGQLNGLKTSALAAILSVMRSGDRLVRRDLRRFAGLRLPVQRGVDQRLDRLGRDRDRPVPRPETEALGMSGARRHRDGYATPRGWLSTRPPRTSGTTSSAARIRT